MFGYTTLFNLCIILRSLLKEWCFQDDEQSWILATCSILWQGHKVQIVLRSGNTFFHRPCCAHRAPLVACWTGSCWKTNISLAKRFNRMWWLMAHIIKAVDEAATATARWAATTLQKAQREGFPLCTYCVDGKRAEVCSYSQRKKVNP